jgi:hypothetical protein
MVITARPPGRRNDVVVEGELTNFVSLGSFAQCVAKWCAQHHHTMQHQVTPVNNLFYFSVDILQSDRGRALGIANQVTADI